VRRGLALVVLAGAGWVSAQVLAPTPGASPATPPAAAAPAPGSVWEQLLASITSHLGKPYVWGATGLKSFDCSGFVWRTMWDTGIPIKRTTARKYFMCLPKVQETGKWSFGNVVFFDDLEHCGIVNDKKTFYHSALTLGTHLSEFDPYWRGKICGVRAIPIPPALAVPPPMPTPTPTPTPFAALPPAAVTTPEPTATSSQ
jgi:cell wall-associated NlpC family hydrolase